MTLPQGQGHLEWLGTVILWPAPSECPREESGHRWVSVSNCPGLDG